MGKAAALLRKALGQTASFRKPETSVSPEVAHDCSIGSLNYGNFQESPMLTKDRRRTRSEPLVQQNPIAA